MQKLIKFLRTWIEKPAGAETPTSKQESDIHERDSSKSL